MTFKSIESIKILLLAESTETARRWAEMLRPMSDCIWLDPSAIPADEQPEVVVTDGTPVFEGDIRPGLF